ncbi:hypothetical protein NGM99_19910 [Mesorhizobium sp. RP14(2022)]|uniref:Uncharacterized protein n=1 Tax=Mesorhizobium liriopis TaxID=2953882 RepID=A0ABT1CD14_9HYPH|nr:hypothetical protein [Mesorhizobium liriopis]MCO6052055.1 hypothetical protein [Mesorhizobium liriopis]
MAGFISRHYLSIVFDTPGAGSYTAPGPFSDREGIISMRAETQNIVDEIKQAISLLRRHL